MSSTKKKACKIVKEIGADHAAYLPEDLIIQNILTRLPVRTLAQWSCISKLWYNSIFKNARFAKTHFAHSKDRKLNLYVHLFNVRIGGELKSYFFSLDNDYKHRLFLTVKKPTTIEPVGNCNGLACITQVHKDAHGPALMLVVNPSRGQMLALPYFHPCYGESQYLCHGFGFDSLSEEYKVVIIFTSIDNEEFITMVFTLGTKSWRTIVTSVAGISPPPGCSPFPSRMVTEPWGNIRTPATLCGADLFWRITNRDVEEDEIIINSNQYELHYNNKIGMLLSFDIHKEKIQFIRLPPECYLIPTPTTTMTNRVVEHHLLEHKGYPCVALSEKVMGNDIGGPCCNAQTSFCCCRFTVQLYILKDKEKQVWIKGDSLGVQVEELGSSPGPLCCCFDSAGATTASLPARLLSVFDQVLLYSFDGEHLKLYNFQTKHLEVVKSSSSCDLKSRGIFEAKCINHKEDNMYWPYLDYQLHAQVENFQSLKSFIPTGETRTFLHYHEFMQFSHSGDNDRAAGWVVTLRELVKVHAFF